MDSLAPARKGFWMKWFHTSTLETRCKSSWDLDFLCRGETTKEGESSILIKSDVRSKPSKKVKHQMMSDRRNWRRWNTRKNKCTHESLAVELLVCLLAIRTSRRINDTFCPRAGESGESAPPEWILSTVPGTNLLPLSPLQVDWMNTTQLNTMGHVVFFFLSRYLQVHNDVPAVSAADKQTYAQCRTYSSEKPESHLSISCLGKSCRPDTFVRIPSCFQNPQCSRPESKIGKLKTRMKLKRF